jgi:hypothetical protein
LKLEEFYSQLKKYEAVKFLMEDFQRFYYELKGYFVIAAFAKDFKIKVEEIPVS